MAPTTASPIPIKSQIPTKSTTLPFTPTAVAKAPPPVSKVSVLVKPTSTASGGTRDTGTTLSAAQSSENVSDNSETPTPSPSSTPASGGAGALMAAVVGVIAILSFLLVGVLYARRRAANARQIRRQQMAMARSAERLKQETKVNNMDSKSTPLKLLPESSDIPKSYHLDPMASKLKRHDTLSSEAGSSYNHSDSHPYSLSSHSYNNPMEISEHWHLGPGEVRMSQLPDPRQQGHPPARSTTTNLSEERPGYQPAGGSASGPPAPHSSAFAPKLSTLPSPIQLSHITGISPCSSGGPQEYLVNRALDRFNERDPTSHIITAESERSPVYPSGFTDPRTSYRYSDIQTSSARSTSQINQDNLPYDASYFGRMSYLDPAVTVRSSMQSYATGEDEGDGSEIGYAEIAPVHRVSISDIPPGIRLMGQFDNHRPFSRANDESSDFETF